MNRNLVLGLAATGLFVITLFGGAFAVDASRDDGKGPIEIPVAAGDPVPLLPARGITGLPDLLPEAPEEYREIEVAGEYVPLEGTPPVDEDGDGLPPEGSGDGFDSVGEEAPPDAEDRGYPEEVEPLPADLVELLFPDFGFALLRWIDFCADNPEGCPPGVGGTVLMPVDDTLAVGEFHLRDQLYSVQMPWWTCAAPSGLGATEYSLLLSATHPARIEIDFYPLDEPAAVQTVVVDNTDPSGRVFGDFVSFVTENGSGPPTGVHHCFLLDGERRARTYVIEARATSFTGETDERIFTFGTQEQRRRPPIIIAPVSDYEATLVVPIKSDSHQGSLVRLIEPEEGLECSEIEDAVFDRTRRDVVPAETGQPYSGYHSRDDIDPAILAAPEWRYDPAYDAYEFWTLNLREGSNYRLCVWWIQTEGTRSYDPAHASIVDRETRWITTPDRLRVAIEVAGIQASTDRDVAEGSFSLRARSHCHWLVLPTARIEQGSGVLLGDLDLCDYRGYAQPAVTEIEVGFADGSSRVFAIATPNTGEPRVEQVTLDLSAERAAGLCGGSFGSCDPPTTVVPGARITLDVIFYDAGSSHRPGWMRGEPFTFEPPERDPPEMTDFSRIDAFASFVEAAGRDALHVHVEFDRPVTLRAFMDGDLDEQCFTGDPPEYLSEVPSVRHDFRLGGLCTRTGYAIGLEATDDEGFVTRFSFLGVVGTYYWNGDGFTDGYRVAYAVNYQTGLVDPFLAYAGATVDGRDTNLTVASRCLVTSTTPPQDAVWAETVEVEIYFLISAANRRDGDCSPNYGAGSWEGNVVATFTIEEFMAGPIRIAIPLESAPGSLTLPDGAIVVVIQGAIRP